MGLGFGVWGLGFGVWGLGFRVQGLGLRVWGLSLPTSFIPSERSCGLPQSGRSLWLKSSLCQGDDATTANLKCRGREREREGERETGEREREGRQKKRVEINTKIKKTTKNRA